MRFRRNTVADDSLRVAMDILIQNQAAMVAQNVKFFESLSETRAAFARMEKDLEAIKSILGRHEITLEKLNEAVRDKIGFKPN